MRGRRVGLAVVAGALLVASCGDDDTVEPTGATDTTGPRATDSTTTTVGEEPGLPRTCDEDLSCEQGEGDVDGDGEADRIGAYLVDCVEDEVICAVRVRVDTATGETAELTTGGDAPPETTGYVGAGDIDGHDGDEILVMVTGGAHSRSGVILTWRDGGLAEVQLEDQPYSFFLDGSISSMAGIECGSDDDSAFLKESVYGAVDAPSEGTPWQGSTRVLRFDEQGDLYRAGDPTSLSFDPPGPGRHTPIELEDFRTVDCPQVVPDERVRF